MKTKIIAMYLPQFHRIPENDKFWGEGFTDWVTVKNAKPLFKGHNQPRVPLNNNYYDLSKEDNIVWQAKLAKEAGIYGFGVYHYWFNNDTNLLTKPAEIMRVSKEVDINYFLAWDNANWKRSWSNVGGNDWAPLMDKKIGIRKDEPTVLIPYILGEERDWEIHYRSVLSHFKSPKYIKVDNKPVFIIFNYSAEIQKMCDYWDELAKKDGFDGMYFVMKYKKGITNPDTVRTFTYDPPFVGWLKLPLMYRIKNRIRREIGLESKPYKQPYDKLWQKLLENAKANNHQNIFHGGFVQYDDSPRRGNKGTIVVGSTPENFVQYLNELLKISEKQNKEFIFLTAWNEWGEGNYLEPDSRVGNGYIEALKNVVTIS